MIPNNLPNNAASSIVQPVPIGQILSSPRDPLIQNSTFKAVDALQSPGRINVTQRDGVGASETLSSPSPIAGDAQPESSADARQRQLDENARVEEDRERQQLLIDQRKVSELSARDREVRAHEQAHAAVGGQYAGAPSYQFERGPDGVNYAVAGEVPIDISKEATPQETLIKAQVVRRAALAPVEPSPQDRAVAAQASRLEAEARVELAELQTEELRTTEESSQNGAVDEAEGNAVGEPATDESGNASETSSAVSGSEPPFFSSSDVSPQRTIVDQISQILAISDVESNRPGALLSQIV